MRFGPDTGPVVALALPPFEEANRTRAFAVALLRSLAAHGIGGILPDLPGQGESLLPTAQARLSDWQTAFAAACAGTGRPVVAASIRAGALVDTAAAVIGRWQLAPQAGADLVRELTRSRQAAAREDGKPAEPDIRTSDGSPVELAGNLIAKALLNDLDGASPAAAQPVRIVRLGTDPRPADLRVDAPPLWRQVEPARHPGLSRSLADDLAAWSRLCAGC